MEKGLLFPMRRLSPVPLHSSIFLLYRPIKSLQLMCGQKPKKDVYGKIVGISTIAAIVTASVALLLMNFSKSGKTVDESRAWLKRIAITWVILNSLGFILAYVTPFFNDGKWNA